MRCVAGQELIVPVPLNFSAMEVTAAICRRVRRRERERVGKEDGAHLAYFHRGNCHNSFIVNAFAVKLDLLTMLWGGKLSGEFF